MTFDQHEKYLLNEWVVSQESARVGVKTTVTCLRMENGYEILGSSACVNPEEYDYELGVYYATKDALKNLKLVVGYVEQEHFNRENN